MSRSAEAVVYVANRPGRAMLALIALGALIGALVGACEGKSATQIHIVRLMC